MVSPGGKPDSAIDRDEVRGIIKKLEKNLDDFGKGSGTPNDVSNYGSLPMELLGGQGFPAAIELSQLTTETQAALNGEYTKFLASYKSIVTRMRIIVDKHDIKEADMTSDIRGIASSAVYQTRTQTRSNSADFRSI